MIPDRDYPDHEPDVCSGAINGSPWGKLPAAAIVPAAAIGSAAAVRTHVPDSDSPGPSGLFGREFS